MRTTIIGCAVLALALSACGGSKQHTESPSGGDDDSASGGGGGGDDSNLIPEEKYDEVKNTFERKTRMVSRCWVQGTSADADAKGQKGHVTIGLTVQPDGHPSNVKVLESSFQDSKVGDCVVQMVSTWEFPTLPKSLDTSYTYVLDRL